MWSSSDLQTRQLPHIGEVMSRALAAGEKKINPKLLFVV